MLTLNCFSKIFQSVDEFVEMQMLKPSPLLDKVFYPVSFVFAPDIYFFIYHYTELSVKLDLRLLKISDGFKGGLIPPV